jgi:hypothetical protein
MFFVFYVYSDSTGDIYGKYQNKFFDKTIEITKNMIIFGFISKEEIGNKFQYYINEDYDIEIKFKDGSVIKISVIIFKDRYYAIYYVDDDVCLIFEKVSNKVAKE